MVLHGDAIDECDDRGRRIAGSSLAVFFNAAPEDRVFRMPAATADRQWQLEIDTANDAAGPAPVADTYTVVGRSLIVLRLAAVAGVAPAGDADAR
jgi:hypothetical protein